MIYLRHWWYIAVGIGKHLLHKTKEESFAKCQLHTTWPLRNIRISRMDLLKIFYARQRRKTESKYDDADDKPSDRACDTDIEHDFIRWHARTGPDHRTERSKIERTI